MLTSLTPLTNKVKDWGLSFYELIPNIISALLVLVLMFFVAKLVKRLICKVLDSAYKNPELTSILGKIVYVIVILLGAMWALSILNLERTVTSLLAGAGIIGLALSFAFQDLATNFVSGFMMAAKRPFEIGDVVQVNDFIGTVQAINLRSTEIITFDGNEVIMPNKILFQNPITNHYRTKTRRIDLAVGVGYDDDLTKVERLCERTISELECAIKDKGVRVIFTEFGDSSINLEIHYWVEYDSYINYREGISEGIKAIKTAFDKHDITIPFPIRTIDYQPNK